MIVLRHMAASTKNRSKPMKARFRIRKILRFCAWLTLAFAVLSILLVLPFRWIAPPTSSFILQNYFQRAESETVIYHAWVTYNEISPEVALAVIAAEDQKFPFHKGFDFYAIRQSLRDMTRGKSLRGASTISQQVSKNLYLWPDRSLFRKVLEAWFTLLIEIFWPKQRILEIYLNIAEMGEHIFGVEAASQQFFHKPPQRLNREEAALLAAVLPNPKIYKANAPSKQVRRRQNWILKQMRQLGGTRYLQNL